MPVLLSAQSLTYGPQVDLAEPGQTAYRPRIVAGSQGVSLLWGSSAGTLWHLSDPALPGAMPVAVHPAGVESWATTWAGADVARHADTVVAVFSTGNQGVGPLYAVMSTDGGATWQDTVRVAPQLEAEARFPTAHYVPGQGPAVQYMAFGPNWSDPRHVVSRSTDHGLTYSPPVDVSEPFAPGEACDCCTGQVVGEGDRLVALFRNNDSNVRTIWGASSVDGGAGFPVGAELDQSGWVVNTCPSSGPDGYVVGDSVRYVWMHAAVNGTKIYHGSAELTSLLTGPAGAVHGGQVASLQQNVPRIAGSGDTLGIVWQQLFGGQREVLFSWSTTGFAGLSVPDTVNADLGGNQTNPDVAYHDGTFHLVWQHAPSGGLQYRTATLGPDVGITRPSALQAVHPVITQDQLCLADAPPGSWVTVLDLHGRPVARGGATGPMAIGALSAGAYVVRLEDAGGRPLGAGRFVK